MKFLTIALVCLVIGASAVEQSGFFDKLKNVVNKAKDAVSPILNNPLVKDTLLPMAQQQATKLANQQLEKRGINLQFAEESGFFDKVKNVFNKAKDAVTPILNNPLVKDTLLPMAQQQATKLANQQLEKRGIDIKFAEVEQSGFFDKIKDFGKKVINNPLVKDTLLPMAQQQATKLANQQLEKRGINLQFAEQSGFFDKIKDFGKKVINNPLVKDTLLPMAQQQATKLANQQLEKRGINLQFAEESGFFDKIKDFGKKVINSDIVKDKLLPFAQEQATKLANQQLEKRGINMQF